MPAELFGVRPMLGSFEINSHQGSCRRCAVAAQTHKAKLHGPQIQETHIVEVGRKDN